MNFKNLRDYHEATWLQYARHDMEGVYITKPEDPTTIVNRFGALKALEIEFDKGAFNKKSFDASAYLEEWFNSKPFEYFGMRRGHHMTKLPDSMARQAFKYLNLGTGDISDLSNVLPYLSNLSELKLSSNIALTLGKGFSNLSKLKILSIQAKNIEDIEEIWECSSLEHLSLRITDLRNISTKINKLRQLKTLILYVEELDQIEAGVAFTHIENLDLHTQKNISAIPNSIFSTSLKKIAITSYLMEGAIQFPTTLQLPNLQEFTLKLKTLKEFPRLAAPALKKLDLNLPSCDSILPKLFESTQIEDLILHTNPIKDDIKQLPSKGVKRYNGGVFHTSEVMDFAIWPDLNQLNISGNGDFKINISDNKQLQRLFINENNFLKTIERLPENIEEISINKAENLSHVHLTSSLKSLKSLTIKNCPNLSSISLNEKELTNFCSLSVENCASLEKLPIEILLVPGLHVRTAGNADLLVNTDFVRDYSKLLKYLEKVDIPRAALLALGFWIFNHTRFETISKKIKENTLLLLEYSNDLIFNLIRKNVAYLNPNNESFINLNTASLKDQKIVIVGNTFDTKTVLKSKAKELGLKNTTKVKDADFILIAKKSKISAELKNTVILLTEKELHDKHETKNPKFLKQEDTTVEHKESLRQILWSTDPDTELMALEMMKNGGLPDEVIGECIAIAKTSMNANVKAKYKSFLKGQVSGEIFKLVSKNVRFNLDNSPFWKLHYEFPKELLGKLAAALYKRTGKFWADTLNFNPNDLEIRMEIVQNILIPKVIERPHYIQFPYNLKNEELKVLLDLPEVKGKLKRLNISSIEKDLPKELGNHISLKELIINGEFMATEMPKAIFKLKRLSHLKINATVLSSVDDKISELKELKEIIIYNKIPISISDELRKLPKIKRMYFSGKVKE
ncbi:leucine-rich repeat domain-containing protein [Cellulophaga baltica]|uniref:Leucine rich repeat-containing protein n=1 Tax=Cellulophaga baltica TaxID=76594 RepID=A0A1G7ISL8_9FLAO|nr:hypothetical protein [Cellulophaga baltica]SDF15720.1 hypothetical protein SAMN04487992_10811 [Cellulophaga baltica]